MGGCCGMYMEACGKSCNIARTKATCINAHNASKAEHHQPGHCHCRQAPLGLPCPAYQHLRIAIWDCPALLTSTYFMAIRDCQCPAYQHILYGHQGLPCPAYQHILIAIWVCRCQYFSADSWNWTRLPGDGTTGCLNLLCALVHVLSADGHLRVVSQCSK